MDEKAAASVVEYLPGSQLPQYRTFRVFKVPTKFPPYTDILTNHVFTLDRTLVLLVAQK